MEFEIIFHDGFLFRSIVEYFKNLNSYITLNITKQEINIEMMSNNQLVFTKIKMLQSELNYFIYEHFPYCGIEIILNTKDLMKLIKCTRKDSIKIYRELGSVHLNVEIFNENNNNIKEISYIAPSNHIIDEQVEYDPDPSEVFVNMKVSEFCKLFNKIKNLGKVCLSLQDMMHITVRNNLNQVMKTLDINSKYSINDNINIVLSKNIVSCFTRFKNISNGRIKVYPCEDEVIKLSMNIECGTFTIFIRSETNEVDSD